MHQRPLVLASTSPFRRQLLTRLQIPFLTAPPQLDERAQAGESPEALVVRLALQKARAVALDYPNALIIGSDQVAFLDGTVIGKPGSRSHAIAQLERASGRRVTFFTGICLLDSANGKAESLCEPFHVQFRPLSRTQIEAYLDREQPYQCAGSFKSEGLGIALFERLEGDDPSALIGLPLIRLVGMLERAGVEVLSVDRVPIPPP